MKLQTILVTLTILLSALNAQSLFEIKDASDNTVFSISDDGLRVFNLGDTLMVISASEIRANLSNSKDRGLSRSFSISTNTTGKGPLANVLEVTTDNTIMREGSLGEEYTNFSPRNIFLGLNAGANTLQLKNGKWSGSDNVFIGNYSGVTNYSGQNNVFMGFESGYNNYDGDYNVFIGYTAGNQNTSGNRNVFIGYEAGVGNGSGSSNTFVGEASGSANTGGIGNSLYGRNAGFSNSTGDYNTIVGYESNTANQTGSYNSCFGVESSKWNYLSGSSNSIFGYRAGYGIAVGSNTYSNNSYFGTQSGFSTTTGSNNSYFGYQSGYSNNTGSGNVFIGYQAGYNEIGSQFLYIDNSNTTQPLIWGDFDGDIVKINADFSVKYHTDLPSLDVDQTLRVDGATYLNAGVDVVGNSTIDGTLALDLGTSVNEFSIDGTMVGNSDNAVPTERAVRTYISSYVSANGDDLGDHTATANIRLNGRYLSNDGGNEGVYVDTGGDVGIGTSSPGYNRLKVISSTGITNISGATGYFENSYSAGIGLAALATSTDAAFYAEQKNTTSTTANIAKFASRYGGSWSEKMNIRSTGRIYTPYLASGTGTYLVLTSSGEIAKYSSSKKFKKDINPLAIDNAKFMQLRPVSFKWNERSATENKQDYGLIAEEVEKIDKDLAIYNTDGTIEGVDYQKINIMLLKVVQDQQNRIDKLESEINEIKNLIQK